MLKIAVITRYFPSSAEPWQGRSAYQTLRLLARTSDVQVFFPNASYPSWAKPRRRTYDALDSSYCTPEVKVSYHDYPALPLISRPFNGKNAARALLPDVQAFGPDLVFSYFVYPEGFAAVRIGKALRVPVAVEAIGSDVNDIGDWITARYTRAALRMADLICTVSDDLHTKVVNLGASPSHTRTVHNGCDLAVFRPGDQKQARGKLRVDANAQAIVYLGRLDLKKGLKELVVATAKLLNPFPRLHVYLVGEGPDRPAILEAAREANVEERIHLCGACAPNDAATWMNAADLIALPSYMEGCPNVVVEALACGRPVVATCVGGIPELLNDDCGRLVPPRDADALAKALSEVLPRNWDANFISSQRNRSWNSVAEELLLLFEALVPARS